MTDYDDLIAWEEYLDVLTASIVEGAAVYAEAAPRYLAVRASLDPEQRREFEAALTSLITATRRMLPRRQTCRMVTHP